MRSVPFENLDVFLRRPLDLSADALFAKIVERRRGGYCFELNGLYGDLLRALGFAITPHLGRVWLRDPTDVPVRAHLVHTVDIDGQRWLTDVGFGGRAPRRPLRVANGEPVEDGDGDGPTRILRDSEFGFRVQRYHDDAWQDQYTFEPALAHPSDIACGNHWTATHPDSHFTRGRFIGLFTDEGRTGLVDRQLTIRRGRELAMHDVAGGDAWLACIDKRFGLRLELSTDEYGRLTA